MPEISTFMYALNTGRDEQDNLVIRAPLNVIKPPYIPGAFSFSVVFGITGLDQTRQQALEVIFKSIEGQVIQKIGPFPLPSADQLPKDNVPPKYKGIVANIDMQNILFEKPGEYVTEVFVDGEKLESKPVMVIPAKSGE